MILRRFSKNIRSQNWFEVGLDLAVVVVGIYIGLQADAWMSAKQDRDLETEYLERLLSDMEESISLQRSDIQSFDEGTASIDYIAEVQKSGTAEGLDEERLILGINNIGWVAPPATNMVTIRELQSTGNISLIRDLSVRMAVGIFDRSYSNMEFNASQVISMMAVGASEAMTWSFMAPRVPGIHKSVTELEDSTYGYIHHYDIDRILKNPDAANITSWMSGWSKYHGAVLMQHHEDTIAFRDLLAEKLSTLQ